MYNMYLCIICIATSSLASPIIIQSGNKRETTDVHVHVWLYKWIASPSIMNKDRADEPVNDVRRPLPLPFWKESYWLRSKQTSCVARHCSNVCICYVCSIVHFFKHYLGTDEDRGIIKWREIASSAKENADDQEIDVLNQHSIYNIPFITKYLRRIKCCRYVPFCATFKFSNSNKRSGCCSCLVCCRNRS